MYTRKRLSDILHQQTDRERLSQLWKATAAADDFAPLPPGEYTFRTLAGELFTAKRGTPGFKLSLQVTEGEHEGRRAWADFWLTPAALPLTKRDLVKIGVTDLAQLEQPLPAVFLIRGRLALRRDDDGNESNRLVRFECLGTEQGDAFEPKDLDAAAGDAFPFGANATLPTDTSAPVNHPTAEKGEAQQP